MARPTNASKEIKEIKEVVSKEVETKETSEIKVANTISEANAIDFSKELEQANEKNKQLESKVDNLTAMLEKLLTSQAQTQTKTESNSEKTIDNEVKTKGSTKKSGFQAYAEIEPARRILIVNMMNAGGTFTTYSGKPIRFDNFGHIQPVRFEELESLASKYRNYFENLELRILDEDVVDALYLRQFYNKYDISVEEMEKIIELNPQALVEKIKTLSTPLQESVLCLIISKVAENDYKYMDKNKWDVLNNAFNINIQEFANRYVVR